MICVKNKDGTYTVIDNGERYEIETDGELSLVYVPSYEEPFKMRYPVKNEQDIITIIKGIKK